MRIASRGPVTGQSGRGRDDILLKSVYFTLFLDAWKSGKFQLESRMWQMSRCLMWICSIFANGARERGLVSRCHIPREVSASLLVQLQWAIPEPLCVGRVTSEVLALF